MDSTLREKVAALVAHAGGQRAFAAKIGVSQSTVSRFLAAQAEMSVRFARALADNYPELKKDIDDFLFGHNMRTSQANHESVA